MLPNLIVPVLNRYDLLDRMLESIDYPIRDLIIIDNGGAYTDFHGYPATEGIDWVSILDMPNNLGVAASWNLGIKLMPQDPVWFFASNDVVFEPGSLEKLAQASKNEITLSDQAPHWQTFAIGEKVVDTIGLFDEGFYPAYYEDNDYMARATDAGLKISKINIPSHHDNSSTIGSSEKFKSRNARTFQNNRNYYMAKKTGQIKIQDQGWNLQRRRQNTWD